jgi:transcriptional regulator with XRE-family HTH domain
LRDWRNRAGYSVERVADELYCGAGTISRMESGSSAEPLRVKAALELYGAPADIVTEMVGVANLRRRRAPRPSYYEFVSPTFAEYVDLEQEAAVMSSYQSEIVPGLLQTEEYARALISTAGDLVAPDDVEKLVSLRMSRQRRLTDDNPIEFRCVIAESTLHNQVGGPAALRRQIRHLIATSNNVHNVELRITPFTAGTYAAFGGNFTILAFRDSRGSARPELVYAENALFFVLQEDPTEVDLAVRVHENVWQTALDPEASVRLLGRALSRLRKT